MFGKITALFLAILVANPFCCCFAAGHETGVQEYHCCQSAAIVPAGAEDSTPAQPEPCDCSSERRGEWATVEIEKLASPSWGALTEIAWTVLPEVAAASRGPVQRASDRPDAVKPPGRVLAQVHCCYLL